MPPVDLEMVNTTRTWRACGLSLMALSCGDGFSSLPLTLPRRLSIRRLAVKTTQSVGGDTDGRSIVVVSPPGGIGEVAAVKAATMGATVKWLVISPPSDGDGTVVLQDQLVLSQRALSDIDAAGGKVDIARSDASSVLLQKDDRNSAISAVETWCRDANGLICTYDSAEPTKRRKQNREEEERQIAWKNAIKVAAKEAAKAIKGTRLAVLSADESVAPSGEDEESVDALKRVVGNLLGGGKVEIPSSLADAIVGEDRGELGCDLFLRYGQLFGTPESSPGFSPFLGGPKKLPELCEEYLMRSVRIDPTLSISGNLMLSGETTRSSRHAIGEAAALMALERVPVQPGLDVSLSSQRGKDPITSVSWKEEFSRVQDMLFSGKGAQLFSADFGEVPSVPRFADWLATKWAPTVLRTFELSSIRVGGRPVYVTQPSEDTVEIIWQQLVNFESVVVGKMTIQVSKDGLMALRGPGDASQGFGEVSRTPLAGEDVLVRRLAEAASQAIEKKLATKVCRESFSAHKCSQAPPNVRFCFFLLASLQPTFRGGEESKDLPLLEEVEDLSVSKSLKPSGTLTDTSTAKSLTDLATGPRQSGVRRSKERARGKTKTSKSNEELD